MEDARHATVDDLPVIQEIVDRVRADMLPHRGGSIFFVNEVGASTPAGSLPASLDDPEAVTLVGTFDDVVFGAAFAVIETLDDGRLVGKLHTFVVQPEAREVGVGRAMMDKMVDELQARGCSGIDSMALPGDRESKNFFESFGLKARLLTVHRSFDGAS